MCTLVLGVIRGVVFGNWFTICLLNDSSRVIIEVCLATLHV